MKFSKCQGATISRKLVGELGTFRYVQDGSPHYAIGYVTMVELGNSPKPTSGSKSSECEGVNAVQRMPQLRPWQQ